MAPAPNINHEPSKDGHLDATDSYGLDHWTQIANKHWLKSSKTKKIKNDGIKSEIWDVLEKEHFQFRSLMVLENLQILESYAYRSHISMSPQIDDY